MLLLKEAHFQELQGREILWEKRIDWDGTFFDTRTQIAEEGYTSF